MQPGLTARLRPALFALLVFFSAWPGAGMAAAAGADLSPQRASAALYEMMSARDLDGVSRLIPDEGFSEIGTEGAVVHQLGLKAFEALFNSQMSIDLHAENLTQRQIDNVAIVTGVRVGAITAKNATTAPTRVAFSMLWMKDAQGAWKLHHIHISPI